MAQQQEARFTEEQIAQLPESSIEELGQQLVDLFDIRDRRYHLRSYEKCFVGTEAVDALCRSDLVDDRDDAVALGNVLLSSGVFHHVTRDHAFKDEHLFYRFKVHDKDHGGNAKRPDGSEVTWTEFLQRGFGMDEERSRSRSAGDDDDASVSSPGEFQSHVPEFDRPLAEKLEELEVSPLDEYNAALLDNVHPPQWVDPEPAEMYNVVVLGAGAGGLVSVSSAAGVGARCAIVEANLMGGDCLNVGCVPSKALIASARMAHTVTRRAAELGVHIEGNVRVDFGQIMERMRRIRASIAPIDSAKRFTDKGVDVFIGFGRFLDANTVEVNGKKLRFKKAIIATGGSAAVPPIPGLRDGNVPFMTNATVFNLTELPPRMAVIGAGPIGCELAQTFQRFGSQVSVFLRSERILRKEDPDAAAVVFESMSEDGVTFHTQVKYLGVRLLSEANPDEGQAFPEIEIRVEKDGEEHAFVVDALLVAAGRKPNVAECGLEAAGVEYDMRHGVLTNDYLQTSQGHIYAVGDCTSKYQFTHVADFMARLTVRNALFFGRHKFSSLLIPWATYTDPEIAHVGLYEHDLVERGIEFRTFERPFSHIDRSIFEGHTKGFVKIHTRGKTDEIIGATIVGENAGDMISEVSVAMQSGIGLAKIASVIHPYPTNNEAVRQCGDAYNRTRLTPTVRTIFRHLMSFQL